MNYPFLVLFILIIVLLGFILLTNVASLTVYATAKGTVVLPASNACTVNPDSVPSLDQSQPICCYNNGLKTGAYYLSTSGPDSNSGTLPLEFSVIPVASNYLTVCREYCNNGYVQLNGNTIQCNGESSTAEPQSRLANACLALTEPKLSDGTPCLGASLPVAVMGANFLYPYHVKTNDQIVQCTIVGPC